MPYASIYFAQNCHWPANVDVKFFKKLEKKKKYVFGEGRLQISLIRKRLNC